MDVMTYNFYDFIPEIMKGNRLVCNIPYLLHVYKLYMHM